MKLILGSGSPRREELLSHLNIPFKVITSDVDESFDSDWEPKDIAMNLAKRKGLAVSRLVKEKSVILSADTIVVLGKEILNKPRDIGEARKMLLKLSGKRHFVITGVALIAHDPDNSKYSKSVIFHSKSEVIFEKLDTSLLENYLRTGESLDKAGAYGIQGASLPFVKEIIGSYSNIVGLPINQVYQKLKDLTDEDLAKIFI